MKSLYLVPMLLWLCVAAHAQPLDNNSCATARPICEPMDQGFELAGNEQYCTQPLFYYFRSDSPGANALLFGSEGSTGAYVLYRLMSENLETACSQVENGNVQIVNSGAFSTYASIPINFNQTGLYIFRVKFNSCELDPNQLPVLRFSFGMTDSNPITCPNDTSQLSLECKDCITSFSPKPGKYMVSAWVKEDGAAMNTITYSNASIGVSFSSDPSTFSLVPSGRIIDGWQRIEGVITVPVDATDIHLAFQTNSGSVYFDDIRFYPLDGSMVSYVYDPVNLRLMAQLDERNYATFYEYDEEGKLIRVKKETERGVMTIQENRDNIKKQ